MECGIDFKGLLFVYDEVNQKIMAWQGETSKDSYTNISGTNHIVKFLSWRENLYALAAEGELLKLITMNTGEVDTWEEQGTNPLTDCRDMCLYGDNIYILGDDNIYEFNGTTYTEVYDFTTDFGESLDLWCMIQVENLVFLYGSDGTDLWVGKFNGTTLTELWNPAYANEYDHSFYDISGKPLLVHYNGFVYWWYENSGFKFLKYNIAENKITAVSEIEDASLPGTLTSMVIKNDMILMSVYTVATDVSQIYVHVLEPYKVEETLPTAAANAVLHKVPSDPILPSFLDRERLVYYPEIPLVAALGGYQPVVKMGHRLEFYMEANKVDRFASVNCKDLIDDLCSAMDAFVIFTPENTVRIGIQDIIGRTNKFADMSDDADYGDLHVQEVDSYEQGQRNFRRVVVPWSNDLIGSDSELVGTPSVFAVDTLELSSGFVSDPISAKNIAVYIYGKVFNSSVVQLRTQYAPYLRTNMNVSIIPISAYMYFDKQKEFKIANVTHDWEGKMSILTLVERKLVFRSLTI